MFPDSHQLTPRGKALFEALLTLQKQKSQHLTGLAESLVLASMLVSNGYFSAKPLSKSYDFAAFRPEGK